jgi:hypothetical protein
MEAEFTVLPYSSRVFFEIFFTVSPQLYDESHSGIR